MKRYRISLVLVFYCALVNAESHVFAVGEYPPYISLSLENGGPVVELLEQAAVRAGLAVDVKFWTWQRAEGLVEMGEIAGSLFWRKTPERQLRYLFGGIPLNGGDAVVASNKGISSPEVYTDYQQFKAFRLVGLKSYWYEETLLQPGFLFNYTNDQLSGLRVVASGRADMMIMNRHIANDLLTNDLSSEEASQLRLTPFVESDISMYVIYGTSYPGIEEIIKKIDQALAEMHRDGTAADIMGELYQPLNSF